MNKIIYITALFFSVLGFSQSVSGKVETEEGLSIANVLVINLKTNEKVNTFCKERL